MWINCIFYLTSSTNVISAHWPTLSTRIVCLWFCYEHYAHYQQINSTWNVCTFAICNCFFFVIYSSLLTGKKYLMEKGNEFYYGIYNFHNIELRTHFDFQFIYSKSYAGRKKDFFLSQSKMARLLRLFFLLMPQTLRQQLRQKENRISMLHR